MADLKIVVQQTAKLDQSTKDAVDHVCMAARPGEMIDSLFFFIPDDGLHIMGYLGEEMVSHAVVTTRWVQTEKTPLLKCAYVDAVSTLPGLQKKGYGSSVMKYLVTTIPTYEIAALQTERVSFYARCGWEVWRGPLMGRKEDGTLVPTPNEGADQIMIYRLPATPEIDLDSELVIKYDGRMW